MAEEQPANGQQRTGIKKNSWRRVVDLGLWFVGCFVTATGLLLEFRLVPGSRGGHGLTLYGMGRHDWGTIHLYASYLIILLVLAHLLINWHFVRDVIARKLTFAAASLGLIGLAIIAFFLLAPIERSGGGGRGEGRGRNAHVDHVDEH